jgi:hypothetical protein
MKKNSEKRNQADKERPLRAGAFLVSVNSDFTIAHPYVTGPLCTFQITALLASPIDALPPFFLLVH